MGMSDAIPVGPRLCVVIPCKDDPRVVRCIESIDAPAEVVVVSNGSPEAFVASLRAALPMRGAQLEVLAEANLSHALQVGIERAPCDDVLLMDSDCLFEPGAIDAFRHALAAGDRAREVYKGEIEFEAGGGLLGTVIARSRRQHTGRPLSAFKPPLALSRRIGPAIGGYFFDPRLRWKEDADLDHRIRRAGIRVVPVPTGRIRHAPLTLRADLVSSFRYGVGAALAQALAIDVTTPSRSIAETWRREGATTGLYMGLANSARRAGYVHTRLRLALGLERPGSATRPAQPLR